MSSHLLAPFRVACSVVIGASLAATAHAAEVTITEEDFEAPGAPINFAANADITLMVVPDPEVGGTRGMVGAIDLSGGAQWGALDSSPQQIALLPLGIAPGTDTYSYTADFFIPSDTTFVDPDTNGIIVRWTDELETGKNELATIQGTAGLPRDEWFPMILGGTIPATFGASIPVTHAHPIISFRDQDPDALVGTAVYVDNIKITATTADEDPNIIAPTGTPFGVVNPGGVISRSLQIFNTGLTNDLVLSAATITGADRAHYGVTTDFPLTIPPGSSSTIDVTFDSSIPLGAYSADLEIASNDVADPVVISNLDALIADPSGDELILNGGFETGNTLGFVSGQSFEPVSSPAEPVHSGEHAAVYTLGGGLEWGAANLDQIAPPAVEGASAELAITPDMIGQPYKFSCWYLRPASGGIADDDTVQMIIRWNGPNNPDSPPWLSRSGADLGVDTWVEYTEEGPVPEFWPEESLTPVTSAFPIFSFRDTGANGVGTERVYIDDLSLIIERPDIPDPPTPVRIVDYLYSPEVGEFSFTWTSSPDLTYRIEHSADLKNWLEETDDEPGAPDSETTSWTHTDAGSFAVRYYRVIRNDPPEP